MKVYLFRHAEKENAATGNPPLSLRGHKQAQKILQLVKDKTLHKPQLIFSSPKIRALQTLEPLATELKIRITESKDLEERLNSESSGQFFNRVKNYLAWIEQQNAVVFLVTHLDWIEESMQAIPCDQNLVREQYQAWGPAQNMEFEIKDGVWHLLQFRNIAI